MEIKLPRFGVEFAPEVVQADGNVKNLAWRICNAKMVLVSCRRSLVYILSILTNVCAGRHRIACHHPVAPVHQTMGSSDTIGQIFYQK